MRINVIKEAATSTFKHAQIAHFTVFLCWIFQSAVVKFNDHRPETEKNNQLFFAVFEWRDPYLQEMKLVGSLRHFYPPSKCAQCQCVTRVFSL